MPPTKCKNLAARLNFQRDSVASIFLFLPQLPGRQITRWGRSSATKTTTRTAPSREARSGQSDSSTGAAVASRRQARGRTHSTSSLGPVRFRLSAGRCSEKRRIYVSFWLFHRQTSTSIVVSPFFRRPRSKSRTQARRRPPFCLQDPKPELHGAKKDQRDSQRPRTRS